MLEFRQVSKQYPYEKFALINALSFSLKENEVLGVVIAPQWGKTTVAKLIAGLTAATSGEVLLEGRPLCETPPKDRGIAVIYDDFALMKNRKFWVNVAYTLKIRGVKKRERFAAAAAALEKFGLKGKEELKAGKRAPDEDKLAAALARASLREFRIIVFDDVFKKAGYAAARRLTEILTAGKNVSQVFLSSDVNELDFCHRILVVADGRDLFCGAPSEAAEFIDNSKCFDILYGVE